MIDAYNVSSFLFSKKEKSTEASAAKCTFFYILIFSLVSS